MRKYGIFLLVFLVSLLGCAQPAVSTVKLESPANGSSVSSLTPILAWGSVGESVSYRLQVATDGDFKNLIIDVSGLTNPSYSVPSGKLDDGKTYYWHVNASKGGQVSPWSTCWAFQTVMATGTMMVNATLNGSSWTGEASYTITGAKASSGSSVPQSFGNLPAGSYTVSYSSGGPPGATLVSITPSATQTLSDGGTITFTLNFNTEATSTIVVNATLDGMPWSGAVSYTITGPKADSASTVTQSFSNLPAGSYTISYLSGSPPGANLASITPSPTQTLYAGGTITFTLNFHSEMTGTIRVKATLDGESWSGAVRYTITGPHADTDYSVPQKLSNRPAGTYALVYNSGGPFGATLASISPSPTQTLSAGGTIHYTLNFYSGVGGTAEVNALLDGQPWQTAVGSGTIRYGISGPVSDAITTMPYTFSNLPAGTYTLSYHSGGPIGATLISITQSPTQHLSSGGTIRYTLNFHSEASGTVEVKALLNGESWEGAASYTVHGPYMDSSSHVPDSFTGCPPGSYTVSYRSGGPSGATLASISPSPTQTLSAGGTIRFTLNFHSEASSGTAEVNALLDGQPWRTAVGSGTIRYGISGPVSDAITTMPYTFSNLPTGTYTLTYHSGGPIGATLISITPSPTQHLSSGGTIRYTLNFHSEASATVEVDALLNGESWEGAVSYTVSGPYMDSSSSVPYSFTGCPPGSYTVSYRSGGPSDSTLASISPSPTQTLSAGGTIRFTLNFHSEASSGTIEVNALLDGQPWRTTTGEQVVYGISGVSSDASTSMPYTFSNLHPGTYTLSYQYGGPSGATLASISPSPTQDLSSGGTIRYTLNFHSEGNGVLLQ